MNMQETKVQANWRYIIPICLVATIGGLLFGYDTGVISGAIEPLTARFNLNDIMKGWSSACVLLGCAAGVLMVGPFSDRFGRKLAMFLAAIMFLVSAIGTALPNDIWTFIVFRVLGGVGIGIASISTPMYIAEITPAHIRGRMVAVNQIAIVSGIAAAAFVNYGIAQSQGNPAQVQTEKYVRLEKNDILYLPSLVSKLVKPCLTNEAQVFLSSSISDSSRAKANAYKGGCDSSLQQVLADDFNRLIESGPVYEKQRFAGIALSKETLDMLAQNPQGEKLQILNKLLILDAFPQEVAKNTIQVWLTQSGWRWMFAAGILPAIIFFFLLLGIPESPRWLIEMKKEQKATDILRKVGGQEFADTESASIRDSLLGEKGTWSEVFSRRLRLPLAIGIALAILQQITGINVFMYFGATIFKNMSESAAVDAGLLQQIVINGTGVFFTMIAIASVDKWGRKPLMIIGTAGMGVSLMAMGLMAQFHHNPAAASGLMLTFIVLYIACFGLSIGPVVWVILAEIFPTAVRGRAMGLATFCLWIADFLVTQTFPIMDAKGSWFVKHFNHAFPFYVYAGFCVVMILVVWLKVPETKGRSLEEIEKSW